MTNFELFYNSTPEERYNNDINTKVRQYLEQQQITVVEEYGGTAWRNDVGVSDNGWVVETDEVTARSLRCVLQKMLSRDVTLNEEDTEE